MKSRPEMVTLAAAFIVIAGGVFPAFSSASPAPGDLWIVTALESVMERDGRLTPEQVRASCHEGVIALYGTVPTEDDRGAAEQLALLIPGVRGIENDLSVAAAVDGDGRLAQTIRSALMENPSIQIKALDVRAHQGVVTLTGVVQERRQRRMADRFVMMTPHVRQVVDHLAILRAA
jgi:hyperosmotically inducible protein